MFAVCKYIHRRHYMYSVETLDITNTFFIGNVCHVYGVDTGNIPCIQLHLHLHDKYYLYVEDTVDIAREVDLKSSWFASSWFTSSRAQVKSVQVKVTLSSGQVDSRQIGQVKSAKSSRSGQVGQVKSVRSSRSGQVGWVKLNCSVICFHASAGDRLYVHVRISSGSDSCAPPCMFDNFPADVFRRYFPSVQLCKSTVSLVMYTKRALPTLGCFPAIVRYKGRSASTRFFVVPSGTPLLGTDLFGALKITIRGMRVVSTLSTTLGPCRAISSRKNFVHEVKVRSDVKPVQQKMRRLPLSVRSAEENSNHEMVVQISNELPAVKYDDIAKATEHCMLLQKVIDCVQNGWPKNTKDIEERLIPFFRIKYELAVQDGYLIRGRHRIVIPESMQGSGTPKYSKTSVSAGDAFQE
ncbi:hypothetical protein M513_12973 [Trichuris suis]|uniref:Uncharacterized protein n=1 Tax=Trichuris suis TaxID=68888 RepID=A0A085LMG9_9BILA|nr:hypothetical protein M513_12973 [Trichuris suis]